MLEFSFLAGVRDDLDEAYNWYESKEIGLVDRFLNYVLLAFSCFSISDRSNTLLLVIAVNGF